MTVEDLAALGTIRCPSCHQLLDATNIDGLVAHMYEKHPVETQELQDDLLYQDLKEIGILTDGT